MFHYQVSSCLSTGVGSRVHAEPLQSRSRVVRTEHILNAKTVQSGCIPLEWLQTRCKPNAKTVQSVPLCSDLPRALPPIWEAASMDQARRTPARGAETAEKTHVRDLTPGRITPVSAAPIRLISMLFRHADRHGSPHRSVGSGPRSANRSRLATPSAI